MKVGVYAGTFDPVTIGHVDIINRAVQIVDQLIIGVAIDNNKNNLFSTEERVVMVKKYIEEYIKPSYIEKIKVEQFKGLLVNFVKKYNSNLIIRGIRAINDFEYEYQLACVNSRLANDVQTIFLPASEQNQYISSRFVKEVARLGGDLSSFSCEYVINSLKKKFPNINS